MSAVSQRECEEPQQSEPKKTMTAKQKLRSYVDPHEPEIKSPLTNEWGRRDSEERDDKPSVTRKSRDVREHLTPADILTRPDDLLSADIGVVGGVVGGGGVPASATDSASILAAAAAATTAGAIPAANDERPATMEFRISNKCLETVHDCVEQDLQDLRTRRRQTLKERWVPIFLLALLASLFVQLVDLTNLMNLPNLLPGQVPSSSALSLPPNPPLRLPTKFWFAHGGRQFEGPTDGQWIERSGQTASEVTYLMDKTQIQTRGGQGNCTRALEVFRFIMSQVKGHEGCLMVAYGQLLHMHRESDFVNEDGVFYDDDIDTWAPPATFAYIATLERQLFENFGWTIRLFLKDNLVVFAQVIASCGHPVSEQMGKATSSQPAIEVYPMFAVVREGNETQYDSIKDIWGGTQFPASMIFPAQETTLNSAGTERPLKLQIPNQPVKILDCLYGNWRLPSPGRQGTAFKHCGL